MARLGVCMIPGNPSSRWQIYTLGGLEPADVVAILLKLLNSSFVFSEFSLDMKSSNSCASFFSALDMG